MKKKHLNSCKGRLSKKYLDFTNNPLAKQLLKSKFLHFNDLDLDMYIFKKIARSS